MDTLYLKAIVNDIQGYLVGISLENVVKYVEPYEGKSRLLYITLARYKELDTPDYASKFWSSACVNQSKGYACVVLRPNVKIEIR